MRILILKTDRVATACLPYLHQETDSKDEQGRASMMIMLLVTLMRTKKGLPSVIIKLVYLIYSSY